MSTDAQLKGDSLRRQLELSKKYADENGLELIENFDLQDIGVSAFTGENTQSGALGKFLVAVRAGKIAEGSYLLVESLDRLSRQKPQLAQSLFLEIINSGIVIVTLADQRKYSADSDGLGDLLTSIVIMSRAHEESAMKSRRVSAAWANKRKGIEHKKLTARCPAWLELSDDKMTFRVIEQRKKVIERIFAEAVSGIGAYSIAKRLNAEHIPAFVSSEGWHVSSVNKIITSPAVIGEFQPCHKVNGKRVADGDPIKKYFPPIIDEETYYSAQALRLQKRVVGGGRRGTHISNIFSKIAHCHYCGGMTVFQNKGSGPKGGTYLACGNAVRGIGCKGGRWRYADFETSFLAFVEELDLGSIFSADAEAEKRAVLESQIKSLEGQIQLLEQERERAYELIKQPGIDIKFVAEKIGDCQARLEAAQEKIKRTRDELNSQSVAASAYYESKAHIKDLIAQIANKDGKDIYKIRAQIAARLKSLVQRMTIAPLGSAPQRMLTTEILPVPKNDSDSAFTAKVRAELEARAGSDRAKARFFTVLFKDDTFRIVFPKDGDPLQFEQQIQKVDAGSYPEITEATGQTTSMFEGLPPGTVLSQMDDDDTEN